jgi:hypothetical protein
LSVDDGPSLRTIFLAGDERAQVCCGLAKVGLSVSGDIGTYSEVADMPTQQEFEMIMLEADVAAFAHQKKFTTKAATWARFTARKQLVTAPLKAVKFVVSKVPLAGPVLKFGVGKISTFLRSARLAKLRRTPGPVSTARDAKGYAKSLGEWARKLDEDCTKHDKAELALSEATASLELLCERPTAADKWLDQFIEVAVKYQVVQSYNDKIASGIEDSEYFLTLIAAYTRESLDELDSFHTRLERVFMSLIEVDVSSSSPLLASTSSSDSVSSGSSGSSMYNPLSSTPRR